MKESSSLAASRPAVQRDFAQDDRSARFATFKMLVKVFDTLRPKQVFYSFDYGIRNGESAKILEAIFKPRAWQTESILSDAELEL